MMLKFDRMSSYLFALSKENFGLSVTAFLGPSLVLVSRNPGACFEAMKAHFSKSLIVHPKKIGKVELVY